MFGMRSTSTKVALLLGVLVSPALAANPPGVGDLAPDFTLRSIGGKEVRLHSLTAEGPVVLVVLRGYPGYQCPVCSAQVSTILPKAEGMKGTSFVFVYPGPADALKDRAAEFVGKKVLPENCTLLLDPDYQFTKKYQLRWEAPSETAYPSTFVIDRGNIVRFAKVSKSHGGRATVKEITMALSEIAPKAP